jgi:hypothetical protein
MLGWTGKVVLRRRKATLAPVHGKFIVRRPSASEKPFGNAPAIRMNQERHSRAGVCQTVPPAYSRRATDERDCSCSSRRMPPACAPDPAHSRRTFDREARGERCRSGVPHAVWPHEQGGQPEHHSIEGGQVREPRSGAAADQQLMFERQRFRGNGVDAARAKEFRQRDEQVYRQKEQIAHEWKRNYVCRAAQDRTARPARTRVTELAMNSIKLSRANWQVLPTISCQPTSGQQVASSGSDYLWRTMHGRAIPG